MSLSIRILPRAGADVRHIYSYIETRSPNGANRWEEAFEQAIQRAAAHPLQNGLAPEDQLASFELRQMLFRTRRGLTYRFVFTVLNDELIVLRVRGPGQPPLTSDEFPLT
jgi:plasmid stabilization system protein ParE